MATETRDATERMNSKKSEFNDGRKRAPYTWTDSFKDWIKQSFQSRYTDEKVEAKLLSVLPFFPESDGKRRAQIINTDIGNGKYIHELYIENTEKPEPWTPSKNGDLEPSRDVVLIHGYAASLGLFIDNYDSLSKIPGIKIHAIDLLGFGFSARPNFPSFPSNTKQDVYAVENWFIDSIEEWRKRRNINRFVLMGHSFGGYLSCAYALKYNKKILDENTGIKTNLIDKLVLISPVGLMKVPFNILFKSVEKDADGNITKVHVNYDNDGAVKKPKTFIHWVPKKDAIPVKQVRIYNQLFHSENPLAHPDGYLADINPDSEEVIVGAVVEPSFRDVVKKSPLNAEVAGSQFNIKEKKGNNTVRFQALREGYFCEDKDSTADEVVLNRIVTLKEDSAKN